MLKYSFRLNVTKFMIILCLRHFIDIFLLSSCTFFTMYPLTFVNKQSVILRKKCAATPMNKLAHHCRGWDSGTDPNLSCNLVRSPIVTLRFVPIFQKRTLMVSGSKVAIMIIEDSCRLDSFSSSFTKLSCFLFGYCRLSHKFFNCTTWTNSIMARY